MNFHKEIEMVHVYRKTYNAQPILPRKTRSDEKFCFYVDETARGTEVALGGKRVEIFADGEYRILKGEPSDDGLKEIYRYYFGRILDSNSSGRFFRDYLSGRVHIDGLGALYKVYGIGDDKFFTLIFYGTEERQGYERKIFSGHSQFETSRRCR